MRAELMQMIGQISLGIYQQLAVSHLASLDEHQELDVERMKRHARDAQAAAKAYFEGLNIAKFD